MINNRAKERQTILRAFGKSATGLNGNYAENRPGSVHNFPVE